MHLEAKVTSNSKQPARIGAVMLTSATTSTSASTMISIGLICLMGSALGAALSNEMLAPSGALTHPSPVLRIHPLQRHVAQCRQLCYRHTLPLLPAPLPTPLCRDKPDCFMCHDYCRVLAVAKWSLAKSMCGDAVFCSQGCRIACDYHRLSTAAWNANSLLKGQP